MSPEYREVQVRAATEADLGSLTDLYNHYVRETPVTFDTEPFTPEQRRSWLLSHPEDGPHRLLVAQERTYGTEGRPAPGPPAGGGGSQGPPAGGVPAGGRLLGYVTSSPFRIKPAYATSVEISVYCAREAVGRGVGTLLLKALFEALADEDVHRAYAGIALPNEASVRLHTRFGFRHVGTYGEVGRKFGRYWDVAWYEKHLG
ncbi:GCN5 family acetyltransferase [Streptomyces sp. CB02923]|uniref:GNAT family N-acetyltransferase n=1 Tax=Streptomyces sp. CB02923 TaxID=1718985 RepID=UPI000938C160|nr:GNAT family N-acetyltransferase [Streptomyces sp. CB02923]OKH97801.1 GCN5 family acetyltransferase [Streptomyces sp. CB02923]